MASDSQVPAVLASTSVLLSVLFLALCTRLWVRVRVLRGFDWDDALVFISSCFTTGFLVCMLISTNYGQGLHRSEITDEQFAVWTKLNVAISCCYISGFVTAKMSFAFLYLRVLPDRIYRRFNKVLLWFLLCQWIEEIGVVLFECNPIHKLWTPSAEGTCLNLKYFFYAVFAVKLTTDLILFIEPIPTMWRLQLPLAKRIGLIFMLSLGLFVCIISIIRVTYIGRISADITYSVTQSMIWSAVEVTALLICSCIPSLRPALKKFPLLNRALGLSSDHSSANYYGTKSGSERPSIGLASRHKDKYPPSQSRSRTNHGGKRARGSAYFGITSTATPKGPSSSTASTDEIFPHDVDMHGQILVTRDLRMDVDEMGEVGGRRGADRASYDESIRQPGKVRLTNKTSESWLGE